ncbi:hypothetical protein ACLMAJ_19465 [Nocardia sp. KC 131]|uniref:hypothetical protein n=1 Tax=Nocardia arseniciresistens TaxID=3392119 RepID=UPI00398EFC93
MPTIPSTNGRFFVVTDCVPQVRAAATAAARGGILAGLTSADLGEFAFPDEAFNGIQACDTTQSGPIAWFGTFNGGVPEGSVYAIDLTTGQVFNHNSGQAAAWTRFVLAEST